MTISIIIIAAACFTAFVLSLIIENRFRKWITGTFGAMAVGMGLFIHSYGFLQIFDPASAAIHTMISVGLMFGGSNEWEVIGLAPIFEQTWAVIFFWVTHFIALYATANTAITLFGEKMLRRIRIMLFGRGTLLLVYGVNSDAMEYGRMHADTLRCPLVFIGQEEGSVEAAVDAVGGILVKDEHVDRKFLRKLGIRPGKRNIEIAALHEDSTRNFEFVQKLLSAFESAEILPGQTRLLGRDLEDSQAGALLAVEGKYGYGSVMTFNQYNLVARLMVQQLPPCDTIRFDENACALENFSVMIVGFGRMGRAVLENLLMNGQFAGSTFRADIFDEHAQRGILFDHEILRQYDIHFHAADGKSEAMYAFLKERQDKVRYIVLCTGDANENKEIAHDLGAWMEARGAVPVIVQCTPQNLVMKRPGEHACVQQSIYGSNALDIDRIDRMAMAINHAYSRDSGKTPLENWRNCDYFSKMSSRASADFYPAVLKAAGKTVQQVEQGDWPPQNEPLENLAITEHMRWCAFHYVMGFRQMTAEEFAQRSDRYRTELQKNGASSVRIAKDMEKRKHACLIPWEELDSLSEKENAVTGKQIDYKKMDRNNILVLPNILKVVHEMKEN